MFTVHSSRIRTFLQHASVNDDLSGSELTAVASGKVGVAATLSKIELLLGLSCLLSGLDEDQSAVGRTQVYLKNDMFAAMELQRGQALFKVSGDARRGCVVVWLCLWWWLWLWLSVVGQTHRQTECVSHICSCICMCFYLCLSMDLCL
jgi:hypothetical protein